MECSICGKEENPPFKCHYCGGYFCCEHRVPESHNCTNLPKINPYYKPFIQSIKHEDDNDDFIQKTYPIKSIFTKIKEKLQINKNRRKTSNVIFVTSLIVFSIYFLLLFTNPDFSHFYLTKISSSFSLAFGAGWIIIYYVIPIPIPLTSHSLWMAVIYFGVLIWSVMWGIIGGKKGLLIGILILLIVCLAVGEPERLSTQDFSTRQQLSTFLRMDNTNQMQYTSDFECIDFSLTLIERAKVDGYRLYFTSTSDHAFCKAYIVSEDLWINVEPQTDVIW